MDEIETTSILYNEMAMKWELIHALLGGTQTMRDAGETWLPREPREEDKAYNLRLNRSFLFNGFANTVEKLISKPFSRPVTIEGILPAPLELMRANIDRDGTDLTQFAKRAFEVGMTYGLFHILVDYPRVTRNATLADENKDGLHPTMILITPPQLIGWCSEKDSNGQRYLTSIRIRETSVEKIGDYIDEKVDYIRLFTTSTWELWKLSDEKFVQIDSGVHTFGSIPLITVYLKRSGYMTGNPPLEDLAWLNLAHWQSYSDQRNILRFVRSGILVATGFNEDEVDNIIIGPSCLITSTSNDATLSYTEHKGQALEAGERDIKALEERMEIMGLQPMIERTARSTATGKMLDEQKVHCNIQAWIRAVENGLLTAFEYAGEWINQEVLDIAIKIFNDFGISVKTAEDIKALITMRQSIPPLISHERFLQEVKRRSLLDEDLDVEQEIGDLEQEGVSLELSDANIQDEEGLEDQEYEGDE